MLTFCKAYANGLPSQAQKARLFFCLDHWVSVQSDDSSMKAQAAFRSAMAVGESANTPPEETAPGGGKRLNANYSHNCVRWNL